MLTMKRTLTCLILLPVLILTGCERPPIESTQVGYRGTGMIDVENPRMYQGENAYPAALPAVSGDGPRAGDVYQNVQVLGDLSVAEFTRLMTTVTEWVSPEQGCNYCHNPANLASDDIYTKVVSRRMFQMTQNINAQWSDHVGGAGVNCYTCHRGNNVPEYIWFESHDPQKYFVGWNNGQNRPGYDVGFTSMPVEPFSTYLTSTDASAARVAGDDPHASGEAGAPFTQTESQYALMLNWSQALDVNCTYCHNSQSFQEWSISTPMRTTAWHGLQMVRDMNENYLLPLGPEYPDNRLGPHGDAPKGYCATCHQGQTKPLNGADAVSDYPSLSGGS